MIRTALFASEYIPLGSDMVNQGPEKGRTRSQKSLLRSFSKRSVSTKSTDDDSLNDSCSFTKEEIQDTWSFNLFHASLPDIEHDSAPTESMNSSSISLDMYLENDKSRHGKELFCPSIVTADSIDNEQARLKPISDRAAKSKVINRPAAETRACQKSMGINRRSYLSASQSKHSVCCSKASFDRSTRSCSLSKTTVLSFPGPCRKRTVRRRVRAVDVNVAKFGLYKVTPDRANFATPSA